MTVVIAYLSFIVVLMAFLASLTLYAQSPSPLYLSLFPVFMLVTTILVGSMDYLWVGKKNNVVQFNVVTTLQFCFFFFVFTQILRTPSIKKLALFSLTIYAPISLLNMVFIQKITVLASMSYSLGCLFTVAFSIFYFYELFQLTHSVDLLRQPPFWICSGLLFYFSCSFFMYSFLGMLKSPPESIKNNLAVIASLIDDIFYSSLTIAFLCRIKIRKSMR
jgi:hypothetical protein